jgi:sporulation protein YlmC with PRC-barrel domain
MAERDVQDRAAVDFAHELISSRRVEGTPVYNRDDEKLGTVHSVMIEKRSGKVAYAVMSFGGLLGFAERVHPIPWDMLTYDVDRDGYVVDLDRDTLRHAPTMNLD